MEDRSQTSNGLFVETSSAKWTQPTQLEFYPQDQHDPNWPELGPWGLKLKLGSNWYQIEYTRVQYIFRLNPNLNPFWGHPTLYEPIYWSWGQKLTLDCGQPGHVSLIIESN